MEVFELSGCCGIRELSGIGYYASPAACIKELLVNDEDEYDGPAIDSMMDRPFIIFSAVTCYKHQPNVPVTYGDKLMRYIRRHKLGTVVPTKPVKNPGSGNTVKAYIWTPDYANLRALAAKYEVESKPVDDDC